jgi:hypothetical protein
VRKITILVVSDPPLARIIEQLFRRRPEFEVTGAVSGVEDFGWQAERLLPELIVADVKPVSVGICRLVAAIRQSSPVSRLILICPVEGLARLARKCGADACLTDERLAGRLLRTAANLAELSKLVSASD